MPPPIPIAPIRLHTEPTAALAGSISLTTASSVENSTVKKQPKKLSFAEKTTLGVSISAVETAAIFVLGAVGGPVVPIGTAAAYLLGCNIFGILKWEWDDSRSKTPISPNAIYNIADETNKLTQKMGDVAKDLKQTTKELNDATENHQHNVEKASKITNEAIEKVKNVAEQLQISQENMSTTVKNAQQVVEQVEPIAAQVEALNTHLQTEITKKKEIQKLETTKNELKELVIEYDKRNTTLINNNRNLRDENEKLRNENNILKKQIATQII
jgi:hypothetical protein